MSTQHTLEIGGGLTFRGFDRMAQEYDEELDSAIVAAVVMGRRDVIVFRSEIDDVISFLISERDRCDLAFDDAAASRDGKCDATTDGDGEKLRCGLDRGHAQVVGDWDHITADGLVAW